MRVLSTCEGHEAALTRLLDPCLLVLILTIWSPVGDSTQPLRSGAPHLGGLGAVAVAFQDIPAVPPVSKHPSFDLLWVLAKGLQRFMIRSQSAARTHVSTPRRGPISISCCSHGWIVRTRYDNWISTGCSPYLHCAEYSTGPTEKTGERQ